MREVSVIEPDLRGSDEASTARTLYRVVLVESNPADTRLVREALAERPGLVLADIQLADDSSGLAAVPALLAAFSVPVIFITAFPERLLTGERPEPTFLITKPFQRATVKAAIAQALFFDQATAPV